MSAPPPARPQPVPEGRCELCGNPTGVGMPLCAPCAVAELKRLRGEPRRRTPEP